MTLAARIEQDGFAVLENAIPPEVLRPSVAALDAAGSANGRAGRRNITDEIPAVKELARLPRLHAIAKEVLGAKAFAVRVLLFDKTPGANWAVGWHQDLAIAVRERIDTPGFFGWSVKSGVPHVHPPGEILENMITLRVHLDDCDDDNGPLRVIPGTHRGGRMSDEAITEVSAVNAEVVCPLGAGGVLVMRPLILHASSPAKSPRHRRVLHIEFAANPLPHGLEWYERSRSAYGVRCDSSAL
jgi:ectoine hydroxylase-related dioxygenase (phytanoyl-CoA dioxygenase family)